MSTEERDLDADATPKPKRVRNRPSRAKSAQASLRSEIQVVLATTGKMWGARERATDPEFRPNCGETLSDLSKDMATDLDELFRSNKRLYAAADKLFKGAGPGMLIVKYWPFAEVVIRHHVLPAIQTAREQARADRYAEQPEPRLDLSAGVGPYDVPVGEAPPGPPEGFEEVSAT